jgi:DNA-binding response OmpR family regulator
MRVLFAADDVISRTLFAAVLAHAGHESRSARDGGEAWTMFQEEPAPLVILDAGIPVLDGLEVCRRIREHPAGRETFILIAAPDDRRDDLADLLDAGADDYVSKPSTPENLRARLEIAARRIAQEEARRAAEAALARARWLAGIGETTIALEHEINNPLSALLGHAELLLMDEALTDAQRTELTTVREQAARIADVVRRLAKLKGPSPTTSASGAHAMHRSASTTHNE